MHNLKEVLAHYGVGGQVTNINHGPLITRIEFKPAPGTKIKTVTSALEDISRELGAPSLRVEAVEENGTLGFELPADVPQTVDFQKLLATQEFLSAEGALPLILGVDVTGAPVIADLAKMPHLLVAGTTGSGKSVGLNTFILSLIARKKPADLKLVLIDPKKIEFSVYNRQKYLLAPVITETAPAAQALAFLVSEMERRYRLFEENLVKNIAGYNENNGGLPYIVCVIDEFADLMAADKNIQNSVQRLAQKARAAGIHIILATQRPSVDVVTGVLKANFPTRLAYKTAGAVDSRTIIDTNGAEKLLGRGDALFLTSGGELKRIHGAYMPDDAIAAMLAPYRGTVKPLPAAQQELPPVSTAKMPKEKSLWRQLWDFWTSLRQKDKRAIINGIAFVAGYFTSSRRKK